MEIVLYFLMSVGCFFFPGWVVLFVVQITKVIENKINSERTDESECFRGIILASIALFFVAGTPLAVTLLQLISP